MIIRLVKRFHLHLNKKNISRPKDNQESHIFLESQRCIYYQVTISKYFILIYLLSEISKIKGIFTKHDVYLFELHQQHVDKGERGG